MSKKYIYSNKVYVFCIVFTVSTWNSDTRSETNSSNVVNVLENRKGNDPSVAVIPNDADISENKINKLRNTGLVVPVMFNSCYVLKDRLDNEDYSVLSVAGMPNALNHSSE